MTPTESTHEAAARLGTTPPTVRGLLVDGQLVGSRVERGGRFAWRVESQSVTAYLERKGRFDGRRRRAGDRESELRSELRELREIVDGLRENDSMTGRTQSERDYLTARVADLQVAMATLHDAFEAQQEADAHRSRIIEHLLAAAAAGEEADRARRRATSALDEGFSSLVRPGQLGDF